MNGSPWGGSEELWSQTAIDLVAQGVPVAASVYRWSPPHERILHLLQAGVRVQQRTMFPGLWSSGWRKLISPTKSAVCMGVERFLDAQCPALVVLSDGGPMPPAELVNMCKRRMWPFVTIGHSNYDGWWPD